MSFDLLILAIGITAIWLFSERSNSRKAIQPKPARRVARRVKAIRRTIPVESLTETKAKISVGYPVSESDYARLMVKWLWTCPVSGESENQE